MLEIPIRVLSYGGKGGDFSEETRTVMVNRDGALIVLRHYVAGGDTVRIVNLENLREADFRIVGSPRLEHEEVTERGVECLDKERTLWDIDFPPPLGTGEDKAGALLECQTCKKQALRVLNLTDVDLLDSQAQLEQLCASCGELTSWAYADIRRRPKEIPAAPQSLPPPAVEKWDGKKERRMHKRVALKLPVLVRNDKGQQELAKTEDVSKGGFSAVLDMALEVGDLVSVVCPYSESAHKIEQRCEVRRRVTLYAGAKWLYGVRYLTR